MNKIVYVGMVALCICAHIEAMHLVGPSFIEVDVQYSRVLSEFKDMAKPYVWSGKAVEALEGIASSARNGILLSESSVYFDVLAQIKVQHVEALGDDYAKAFFDTAYAEALARSSYMLLYQGSKELESLLSSLEEERMYWLWCQAHPWKYFFSKSPVSWFKGKGQEHQVAEKLQKIEQLSAYMHAWYGSFLKHRMLFLTYGDDVVQRSAWVEKSLALCSSFFSYQIAPFQQLVNDSQEFDALRDLAALYTMKMGTLRHQVHGVKRSSHMVRYWIPYTIAAAGGAAVWLGYHNNKESVDTFVSKKICDEYPTALKEKVVEIFYKRFKDFFDLLLDKNKPKRPDFSLTRKQLDLGAEDMIGGFGEIQKGTEFLLEKNAAVVDSVEALKNLEINPIIFESKMGKIKITNFESTAKDGVNRLADVSIYAVDSLTNVNVGLMNGMKHMQKMVEMVKNVSIDTIDKAEFYADQTDELMNKKLSVLIGMLAMVPAVTITTGVGTLSYKAFKKCKHWLTKHDFRMIRARLSGIHDVLINADGSMTDEQYGRFVYHAQKLYEQAHKNVPYYYRDAFIAHLKQLVSATLNVQQKKETIDNMRATYDFLLPTFVA